MASRYALSAEDGARNQLDRRQDGSLSTWRAENLGQEEVVHKQNWEGQVRPKAMCTPEANVKEVAEAAE